MLREAVCLENQKDRSVVWRVKGVYQVKIYQDRDALLSSALFSQDTMQLTQLELTSSAPTSPKLFFVSSTSVVLCYMI